MEKEPLLQKLQTAPPEQKKKWVIVLSSVLMAAVIFFWILLSGKYIFQTSNSGPANKSFFSEAGEKFNEIIKNFKATGK